MSAVQDVEHALLSVRALESERDELQAEVKRLARQHLDDLDTINELQSLARRQGLSEQTRRALATAANFLEEGDEVTSPRVIACVLQALGIAKRLTEEAA